MKMASTTTKNMNMVMLIVCILLAVVLIGSVGVGWYYILKMSDTLNKSNTEIYTVKAQTEKLSELSWRYQRVLPKKPFVMSTIPDSKDESSFMTDMEAIAVKDGLTVERSSIGNSQKGAQTGALSQTMAKDGYYELPIRYAVSGLYSNFVEFINELSTLRRLSTVDNISVTADYSDKTSLGKVKVTFEITIYVKK